MKAIFKIDHRGGSTSNDKIHFVEAELEVNSSTTVNDVFNFFDDVVQTSEGEKECARFCRFIIHNRKIIPIDNFNFLLFIKLNEIDLSDIQVSFCYGGIGGGDYINDKMKIFIPSSEKNHMNRPHIHVSNCKGSDPVVFSLTSLKIYAGRDNWERYFNRKERKDVERMLKEYQKEFIQFYNELSKGCVPTPVFYKYGKERKTGCLKQDNITQ